MSKLALSKSVYIQTQNTRNVVLMMDDLKMDIGEGRFGVIVGGAGLGKSEAVKWYHARNEDTVYLESTSLWKTSELTFLRDLCKELGTGAPRHRKEHCFRDIIEHLYDRPQTIIFIDEVDRLSTGFLEVVRDITRMTMCPIVLIGEKRLLTILQRNERVWTRTFEPVTFSPMQVSDVIIYAQEAVGVELTIDVAQLLHQTSTRKTANGNFRLVKRAMQYAIQYANAKDSSEITKEIATAAIKSAVKWATK